MAEKRRPPGSADPSSGPIEYKDAPVRFTFLIDGREEPVRIVEPTIDLPFPDGARLLVDEGEARLCEVVFRFDMDAERPYRLTLAAPDDAGRMQSRELTYGEGVAPESEMRAVYHESIVERGNLRARIEMTLRKARLQIDYLPGRRIPPTGH